METSAELTRDTSSQASAKGARVRQDGNSLRALRLPRRESGILWMFLHSHGRLAAFLAAVVLVTTTVVCLVSRQNPVDQFWSNILTQGSSPLICLGDIGFSVKGIQIPQNIELKELLSSNSLLVLPDVVALSRISSIVLPHGDHIVVQNSASTTLSDLRHAPVILIGGRDNQWSMHAMQQFRYRLVHISEVPLVIGVSDAVVNKIPWVVDFGTSIARTYAIVARFYDPTTGQPAILAAGIGVNGTLAAAEFLTSPEYLRQFAKRAPRGWEKKNVEIVIEAVIINNDNGPPHIVAINYW